MRLLLTQVLRVRNIRRPHFCSHIPKHVQAIFSDSQLAGLAIGESLPYART